MYFALAVYQVPSASVVARAYFSVKFTHREASAAVVISYYWHFVDVVWIALFGIVYVLPLLV